MRPIEAVGVARVETPDESDRRAPVLRGAPTTPRVVEMDRGQLRLGPVVQPPSGAVLRVVTPTLDDERQAFRAGDVLYPVLAFAFARRDWWTDDEHRDYWAHHLHLVPRKPGKPRDIEALAFAIVEAEVSGVEARQLWKRLEFHPDGLRPSRELATVIGRMRSELGLATASVERECYRVPRVVTDEEYARRPLLSPFAPFGLSTMQGDLSQSELLRALKATNELAGSSALGTAHGR
jgi:hypothetical protein